MAGKKQIGNGEKIAVISPDNLPLITADLGVIAFMGRDFEIALLAMSPRMVSISIDKTGEKHGPNDADMRPSYLATAKVRLGAAAMAQIGGGILAALKDVDPEAFQQAMQSLNSEDVEGDEDGAVH